LAPKPLMQSKPRAPTHANSFRLGKILVGLILPGPPQIVPAAP